MKVHTVEKARKDFPNYGIKKGDKYYWWKFRMGGKVMSKTYPKRSQLTQSGFLSTVYELQDRIGNMGKEVDDADSLDSFKSDIVSELESLKDECESNLSNMPEHLQESSSSGQLLTERIEQLESSISEFEDIDCSWDDEPSDEDLRREAIEDLQLDEDDEESLQDREKEIEEAVERIRSDKLQDWVNEKIEEFQNASLDF